MTPPVKSVSFVSCLLPILIMCFPTAQSQPLSENQGPRSASPIALNPSDYPPSSTNLTSRRYTCGESLDFPGYTTYLADFLPSPRYLPLRTFGFSDIAFQHLVWAMGGTGDPAQSSLRFLPIPGGSFVYEHLSWNMWVRLRQAPGPGQPIITYAAAFHALVCLREYAESKVKTEFYTQPLTIITDSFAGGQAIIGTFGPPGNTQIQDTP